MPSRSDNQASKHSRSDINKQIFKNSAKADLTIRLCFAPHVVLCLVRYDSRDGNADLTIRLFENARPMYLLMNSPQPRTVHAHTLLATCAHFTALLAMSSHQRQRIIIESVLIKSVK